MTIWSEVISYVRVRYEVLEERENWLRFRLGTEDGRSQQVTVHHLPDKDGAEWAEISSAVGWADKIDLRRLLELAGSSSVGGAAVVDGVALIKHTVPLLSLDIRDEFEQPMRSVAAAADSFERELSKSDEF
ncbi:YbjN domain-containing protein [Amycolatopsis acidicola]|uniref:YbjN domain-containing protein n=1 Tax=Amycolatopsis acidicola TaxID=2596893 RepID=A0A5N0VAB5_9PSEU|nr:YbjN domain-containing protein [Amycolatopsis acidicola]KAA9162030.1 YbjN domain-containing protein [Amycolatopsis acidicola]